MGSGSFEVRSSPFYRQLCVPTEHISNIKLSQTIPKHHTPFYGFCSDCIQKKTEAGTNTNTRTTSVFRTATLSKIKQDLSGVVCIDIEGLVLEKMRLSQKEQHIAKAASSIVAFSVHWDCCFSSVDTNKLDVQKPRLVFAKINPSIESMSVEDKIKHYFCSSMYYIPFATNFLRNTYSVGYGEIAVDFFVHRMTQLERSSNSSLACKVVDAVLCEYTDIGCCCNSRTSWIWAQRNLSRDQLCEAVFYSIAQY
jgi:hypothetical protein